MSDGTFSNVADHKWVNIDMIFSKFQMFTLSSWRGCFLWFFHLRITSHCPYNAMTAELLITLNCLNTSADDNLKYFPLSFKKTVPEYQCLWSGSSWTLLVVFFSSGFRSPLSSSLCFITMVLICVSLCCFKDEVKDNMRTEHIPIGPS